MEVQCPVVRQPPVDIIVRFSKSTFTGYKNRAATLKSEGATPVLLDSLMNAAKAVHLCEIPNEH